MKTFLIIFLLTASVFAQDTIRPVAIAKPAPTYPEDAKKLRVEAQFLLHALISATGTVMETELAYGIVTYPQGRVILESKNDLNKISQSHRWTAAKLLELSHTTAKKWKFKPALINGKPEESMIVIPFVYQLQNNPKPNRNPMFQLKK